MSTIAIPVSEAKNKLSSLLKQVETSGTCFIIENRGRKIARLEPYDRTVSREAFGALSDWADPSKRKTEDAALEAAVVNAYATVG